MTDRLTSSEAPIVKLAGEVLARQFHEVYERLAPSFGYETRADTRAFDSSTPNGHLMTAVCDELLRDHVRIVAEKDAEIARLRADHSTMYARAHEWAERSGQHEARAEAMEGLLRECHEIMLVEDIDWTPVLGSSLRGRIAALLTPEVRHG